MSAGHATSKRFSEIDATGVPRLALSVSEACDALGCSWDFFAEHVAPELRVVRRGRRKLIAVAELARWLDENAESALPHAIRTREW